MTKQDLKKQIRDAALKSPYTANIKRLALFGSRLHGNATGESDIDLLIELKEPVGLFTFVDMHRYFADHLGKKVDLVTPQSLSKYFRNEVLAEAEVAYER